MFGISFWELVLIGLVGLVAVGPKRLPGLMRTLGEYLGQARRLTSKMREQSGIDEVLRSEGIQGGLTELRGLMRGDLSHLGGSGTPRFAPPAEYVTTASPYGSEGAIDPLREYPAEGVDAYDALPDDLVPMSSPETQS